MKSIFFNKAINEDLEAEDNSNMLTKISKQVKKSIEIEKSYKSFFICFGIGLGIIGLSMLFLPTLPFFPQKFLSIFSIGSIVILFSFMFVYGTTEYLKMLFEKERILFSILYISSIILGIYFSFYRGDYILSVIMVLAQLVMLIIFVFSFIPGGKYGINVILSVVFSPLKLFFAKIKEKPLLPI